MKFVFGNWADESVPVALTLVNPEDWNEPVRVSWASRSDKRDEADIIHKRKMNVVVVIGIQQRTSQKVIS